MRTASLFLAAIVTSSLATACTGTGSASRPDSHAPGAEQSLALLRAGNERFAENRPRHPHSGAEWRRTLVGGQRPFAVVLGCADSRVPVERVFDRGFGDLFVIRNAGNVAASDVLASIDYATTYLHAPLVVVMGHEKCGAVAAALGPKAARAGEGIDLQSLLDMIDPALEASHVRGTDAQAVDAGVEANVRWTVARLREDGANGTLRGARDVMFVGAVYDLESGRVRFLDSE